MKNNLSLNIALLTLTLLAGNRASAAIVYSGIQNVTYSKLADPGAFSLFNAPGNWDDIKLRRIVFQGGGFQNQYYFEKSRNFDGNFVEFALGSGFSDIKNFSTGNLIGGASTWSGDNYKTFSFFQQEFNPDPDIFEHGEFRNTTGYAGLRFTDGGNVYYGWMQTSVTNYDNGEITGTLIDWAYDNTPGQAILAGAIIPEPTTVGLLFGVAAVSCLVRRKRK